MKTTDQEFKGIISKPLVVILIVVIMAGAGLFCWIYLQKPASQPAGNTTSQNSPQSQDTTATTSQVTDNSGASEEINALDKSMTELDDDSLSDKEISDVNIGL